jgi:hypothetical protein
MRDALCSYVLLPLLVAVSYLSTSQYTHPYTSHLTLTTGCAYATSQTTHAPSYAKSINISAHELSTLLKKHKDKARTLSTRVM